MSDEVESLPVAPVAIKARKSKVRFSLSVAHPDFAEKKHVFLFYLIVGMLLSFCAGFINGCALLGFGGRSSNAFSVAGVTGAYTNIAILGLSNNSIHALDHLGLILSYIAGAVIPGSFLHNKKAWELCPEYCQCFFIGTLILIAASVIAEYKPNSSAYFFLIAGTCGLQNGMTSTFSANLIRSSHLTGTTTDIGLILGQILRGTKTSVWKLKVLIALAASFFIGSLVSYPATMHMGFSTMVVNIAVFFFTGVAACVHVSNEFTISICEVLFGVTYSWERVFNGLDFSTDEAIESFLDRIDWNEKGHIDHSTFRNFMTSLELSVSEKYITALLDEMKQSSSRPMSRSELKGILENTRDKGKGFFCSSKSPTARNSAKSAMGPDLYDFYKNRDSNVSGGAIELPPSNTFKTPPKGV